MCLEVVCPAVRERAPRIRYATFGDMLLPVPPPTEQARIIAYIDTEVRRVNTALLEAEREIQLIQEYRTALITEAVTGKIDVRAAVVEEVPA